jgi:hypothetical protein
MKIKYMNPNHKGLAALYGHGMTEDKLKEKLGISKIVSGRMYMIHLPEDYRLSEYYGYGYRNSSETEPDEQKKYIHCNDERKNLVIGPALALNNLKKMDQKVCFWLPYKSSYNTRDTRISFGGGGYYRCHRGGFQKCYNSTYNGICLIRITPIASNEAAVYFQPISSRSKLYKESEKEFLSLKLTSHSPCYNKAMRVIDKKDNINIGNAFCCPCYTLRRKPRE